MEVIVPQEEHQLFEKDYLNETVEGDVTMLDDITNIETDDNHQFEILEVPREEENCEVNKNFIYLLKKFFY